jgi:hypothetical protein
MRPEKGGCRYNRILSRRIFQGSFGRLIKEIRHDCLILAEEKYYGRKQD